MKREVSENRDKLGFVPGKRTFQTYMWCEFNIRISVKRYRTLMREMHLVANKPKVERNDLLRREYAPDAENEVLLLHRTART